MKMKILEIKAIEFNPVSYAGIVEVVVELTSGAFWWKKTYKEVWQANSKYGKEYQWSHTGFTTFRLTDLIKGYSKFLEENKTVFPQPRGYIPSAKEHEEDLLKMYP